MVVDEVLGFINRVTNLLRDARYAMLPFPLAESRIRSINLLIRINGEAVQLKDKCQQIGKWQWLSQVLHRLKPNYLS